MLLAQTSSRSLRRPLLPLSSSRSLSSSFVASFPRGRPFTASEGTKRTLGSLVGFRGRPPHRDSHLHSTSSSSPPSTSTPRPWSKLLPTTWASRFLSTPSSRTIKKEETAADSPPPPSPPPAPPPSESPSSPTPPPSTPASSPPAAPPPPSDGSEPTPSSILHFFPPPPPPGPHPELSSEETLAILQATIIESLHVGRNLQGGKSSLSSSRGGDAAAPEPIVGIYCPLEGGSYVLDAAIEEIASRLGGDLVELDALELGAEGLGTLGPATSAIPLSPNPLKIGRSASSKANTNVFDSSPSLQELEDLENELDEDLDADEDEDFEDEDDLDVIPSPPRTSAAEDHSLSSSGATRSNDWKAGAAAVAEATSKEDSSSSSPSKAEEKAVKKEDLEEEEVNDHPRPQIYSTFSTLDDLKKATTTRSAPAASSQEILSQLFTEIVNAERVTPKPSSVDVASSSVDETSLPTTSTPSVPSISTSPTSSSSPSSSPKPRIIYIKNAIDMAGTFNTSSSGSHPSWFSELLVAVRARRAASGPTTVVLGLSPSNLQTATTTTPERRPFYESLLSTMSGAPKAPPPVSRESILWAASSETRSAEAKTRALMQRIVTMIEGQWGSLLPSFEGSQSQSSSSSSEAPRSLSDILSRFPPSPAGGTFVGMPIPLSAFLSPTGRGKDESSTKENSKTIWKVVGVLPRVREVEREKSTRNETRRRINELLFRIGAKTSHAVLDGNSQETLTKAAIFLQRIQLYREELKESYDRSKSTTKTATEEEPFVNSSVATEKMELTLKAKPSDEVVEEYEKSIATLPLLGDFPSVEHSDLFVGRLETTVFSWEEVVDLSGLAAGLVQPQVANPTPPSPSSTSPTDPSLPIVEAAPPLPPRPAPSTSTRPLSKDLKLHYGWDRLSHAFEARRISSRPGQGWLGELVKEGKTPSSLDTKESSTKAPIMVANDGKPDPIVEAVKNDPSLTKHEQKIIGTIVDPKMIRDSFSDVHLPEKTVDAIRSVVSLPLLFPEAFSTGILKNHSTTGALLFGPPGTGKTLLVRALAKESGARMMSIQPSDVMDMYFGEAEKLVKAVFRIARRLAPCIIFVDEIDALFQARSGGGGAGGGDNARRQMLTEFMQEMDGLNSSAENRERGLIMIGATNRPQDLDEAVLRRLPRRLLIDLPGEPEREAILRILLRTENLGPDVDLKQLAKDTPLYSGSDLKHLCVVAAQEAVKELYTVPWAKKATPTPASPSPSTPAPAPTPSTSAATPTEPSTPETLSTPEPEVTPSAPTKESKLTPVIEPTPTVVPDASPSPSSPSPPPTASLESSSETPSDEPVADPPTPQPAPSSDTTLLPLSEAPADLTIVPESVAPSPAHQTSATEPSTPTVSKIKPRILTSAHFKIALDNSSSSGSEEVGALPELRKWNEQFGDAGTKKNKKSGFGKGFGFGDAKKEVAGKDGIKVVDAK